KAYWAFKHVNFDHLTAGDHQKVQLNDLNKLRDQAYENSLIYKEKTKRIHDSKIKDRVFNIGDRVLLFNSRLKIFSDKLKTRWTGPFTVIKVCPYGTVELSQTDRPDFKDYVVSTAAGIIKSKIPPILELNIVLDVLKGSHVNLRPFIRGIEMKKRNIQDRSVLSIDNYRAFIQVTTKDLGDVEEDLVKSSEDGVGLSFNASMLAIKRWTFNKFSRRLSSSISSSSGITISATSKLKTSES
nr:reverse transcriptase domain-containing protein [Tanacetum cinerariifolium]